MTKKADNSGVGDTVTDVLEFNAEFPELTTALRGLVVLGQRLVLGLVAGGPRSGVLRVSQAESAEFEALLSAAYKQHRLSLIGFATRRGAGSGAEDVVHQAFEKVWQRQLRPAEIGNIAAYVQTAVRNETCRELKRARTDQALCGGDSLEVGAVHGGSIERVVDRITLHGYLVELPPRECEAIVLHVTWDLSVEDTAKIMGISPGTVKRYCYDGLRRLSVRMRAA